MAHRTNKNKNAIDLFFHLISIQKATSCIPCAQFNCSKIQQDFRPFVRIQFVWHLIGDNLRFSPDWLTMHWTLNGGSVAIQKFLTSVGNPFDGFAYKQNVMDIVSQNSSRWCEDKYLTIWRSCSNHTYVLVPKVDSTNESLKVHIVLLNCWSTRHEFRTICSQQIYKFCVVRVTLMRKSMFFLFHLWHLKNHEMEQHISVHSPNIQTWTQEHVNDFSLQCFVSI